MQQDKLKYLKLVNGAELIGLEVKKNTFINLMKIEIADGNFVYLHRYSKFSKQCEIEINNDQIIISHECDDDLEQLYYTYLNFNVDDFDDFIVKALRNSSNYVRSSKEDVVMVHSNHLQILQDMDVSMSKPN